MWSTRTFRNRFISRGAIWIVPCVASWSLIPRLALNPGNLDAHQYLFWSSLVSAGGLLLMALVFGRWPSLRALSTTDVRRQIALASLGPFGYYALLYSAYGSIEAGSCCAQVPVLLAAQYLWPAFAVLWCLVLLGERITALTGLALLLGIVAVAIGTGGHSFGSETTVGVPFAVAAAIAFGLYSALLKQTDYEPLSTMAVGFTAATVVSFLVLMLLRDSPGFPDARAIGAVAVHGLLVNCVSFVCWYRALRCAPIARVAPWAAFAALLSAPLTSSSAFLEGGFWIGFGLAALSAWLLTKPPVPQRSALQTYGLAEEST